MIENYHKDVPENVKVKKARQKHLKSASNEIIQI
jgi:hypothetical protein